jgi:beta-mannosidase
MIRVVQALCMVSLAALALGGSARVLRAQAARDDERPGTSLAGPWRYLPDESGRDLAKPELDDSAWPEMALPSNWFLKGHRDYPVAADMNPAPAGAIGNWGDAGHDAPDRGLDYSGHVWFRRHVRYTPAGGAPVILRFEMVDYFADVYVNGVLAGTHEGSFQPFEFNVTPLIRRGDNVIAVKVGAPALIFDWTEEFPVGWPKRQALIKGVFGYHDTRPGGTTARGQERGTGGIVGDVSLRQIPDGVDIALARVAPSGVSADRATLDVEYVLHNWTTSAKSVTLSGEIAPANFKGGIADRFSRAVTAAPGETHVAISRTIDHPALWWTWDYGRPNLYSLRTSLGPGAASRTDRFGVRSIRRDDGFVWYLNGRRIFPRGTNYISTQWLSQADAAWYERDLKLMLGANLNSVRVHAHLERPEFYEMADAMGLMVWQDFPLQWGYTDLPEFQQEALRQLRDMIELNFNHPSIIAWSMHNEAPHAMPWMQRKVPDQNLALDESLVALARRLDSTRVLHRDSGTGDGHPYPGWYSGTAADYATLPGAPFITEYGAQALPGEESMKTMVALAGVPANDAQWNEWAFHNFQREQTFNLAKLPATGDLPTLIRTSQNYQAAVLRFATETYRRAKWSKVTGLYQFMFLDDWPSITWSVLDYYRRPKRGYAALASAMQPVLPSIAYRVDDPNGPIAVWVVNDRFDAYPKAQIKWRIGAGAVEVRTIDVPADGVIEVADLGARPDIARGDNRLEVWIEDAAGHVLGRNTLEAADYISWKQ